MFKFFYFVLYLGMF